MDFVNSETFVWLWFGLWSIGAKPAFVNTNLTGKPLAHTVKTSTARLVVVDEEARDKFNEASLREHGFEPTGTTGDSSVTYQFEMDQSEIPRSVRNQTTTPQAAVEAGAVGGPTSHRQELEIVFFDQTLASHIATLAPNRLPDAVRSGQKLSSMAMLIYTSGTTGLPKPAIFPWGKCSAAGRLVALWLGLRDNIMHTSMPLYHSSAAVLGVCAVLRGGGTLCLSKKFSHKTFWPEVRASNATIIHYVGETCRYLLSAPPSALDKQHKVRAAFGNGLRADVWEPFKTRFGIQTIYEFYSATEAPGGLYNLSSNSFSAGAIGRNGLISGLLMNANAFIARMHHDSSDPVRHPATGLCEQCSHNEPGELLFKVDAEKISEKFQGYFGNDKATNSKIIRNVKKIGDAYFRSGDLIRVDNERRWWFVDRIGDTFRWHAENVSTAEVSEALGRHPAIVEANVYGVNVPRHDGRAGCAAVILRDNKSPSEVPEHLLQDLAAHVTKELPAFARPVWIRVTKEMAMTGTNKQQKNVLQGEGIDTSVVEEKGDVLYWLRDGGYKRFAKADLEKIEGGGVKL